MTVATLPLPSPTLTELSAPTLRIGQRELTAEQVFRYLSTSKLLPQLIRDILLEDVLHTVPYTPEELEATGRSLAQQNQYRHLDDNSLKILALRFLRIEKLKELSWGKSLESYFLKRRQDLDQVICSLIQTPDASLAQELYFRIQNQEASFEQLAQQYSRSSEVGDQGRLGPIALSKLHPEIAKHLRGLKPGEMAPVFILGQECILIRLDQFIPAQMNESIRQLLMNELFENWLETEVAKQLGTIVPPLLQAPDWTPLRFVPLTEAVPQTPQTEISNTLDPIAENDRPESDRLVPQTLIAQASISPISQDRKKPRPPSVDLARRKHRSSQGVGAWSMVIGGILVSSGLGATYWLSQEQPVEAIPASVSSASSLLEAPQNLVQPAYDQAITASTLNQIAQTEEQWEQVMNHWQAALLVLATVPPEHPQFALAQEKQALYQKNLNYAEQQHQRQGDVFRRAVEAATAAADKGQTAQTAEEWLAVGQLWQTAMESMAAVSTDHPRYAIAQQRVPIYQANWEYVQHRSQQVAN